MLPDNWTVMVATSADYWKGRVSLHMAAAGNHRVGSNATAIVVCGLQKASCPPLSYTSVPRTRDSLVFTALSFRNSLADRVRQELEPKPISREILASGYEDGFSYWAAVEELSDAEVSMHHTHSSWRWAPFHCLRLCRAA